MHETVGSPVFTGQDCSAELSWLKEHTTHWNANMLPNYPVPILVTLPSMCHRPHPITILIPLGQFSCPWPIPLPASSLASSHIPCSALSSGSESEAPNAVRPTHCTLLCPCAPCPLRAWLFK